MEFSIEPRPMSTEAVEVSPRPIVAASPQRIASRGVVGREGATEGDRLLSAIIVLARKEPMTNARRMGLRQLVLKTAREIGLDF